MGNIKIYSKKNPLTREEYSEIYKILEYSFPGNERRNFDGQFGELAKDCFRCMCTGGDGKLKGFMSFWELEGFIYLEHFAVAKDFRRQGIGSVLLKELRVYSGERPIVLEVEPPQTGEYAAKRIEYYKQRGFFVNEYEYYQPPYNDGDKPVRLLIMSSPGPLSREEFNRIRDILYRDAYETDEYSLQPD